MTSAATGGSEHTLCCKLNYLKNQRNPFTIKAIRYLNVLVTIFLGLVAPKLINLRMFLDFKNKYCLDQEVYINKTDNLTL